MEMSGKSALCVALLTIGAFGQDPTLKSEVCPDKIGVFPADRGALRRVHASQSSSSIRMIVGPDNWSALATSWSCKPLGVREARSISFASFIERR